MSAIEFRTLGTMDLRAADGRELHSLLAQPKRIALLAYLCIAEPRGYHRRDTLLGLFWPDSDQEHARTSLRKSLHILRRSLGEDAILSRGDEEVTVDRSRISCDVVSFDELIGNNRFEDALELYRGDLLTGFFVDDAPGFEHWLHGERNRIREAAAHAAFTAAGQLQEQGDHFGAIRLARRSLELADTDERTLRMLMSLQLKAGDRAAAIETYESFARALAADYQTQPSEETNSLIEQIRPDASSRARGTIVFDVRPPTLTPTDGADATSVGQARIGTTRTRRSERGALAAALGILILGGFIWAFERPATSRQVVRYTLVVDSSEAMTPGEAWWTRLALSPDGATLAYVGGPRGELLVRPRDQLHATAIPGTKGAQSPFFSPDGKRIGYLGELRVYIAPMDGSPPVMVSDSLSGTAGASWSPDGTIYVDGKGYAPLLHVEAKAGATPVWFTSLDTLAGEFNHSWPDVLPNGKGVLFGVTFRGTNGVRDSLSYAIAVADIPSGQHHIIVRDAIFARYATSGHLLYVTTNKRLMVAPFDQSSMQLTGPPTVLIDSMRLGRFGAADLAVSATGTLAYVTGGGQGRRELVWVSREARVQQVDPDWLGEFWAPSLSPDGKRLTVTRRLNTPRFDVMVKELDRGPSIKLSLLGTGGDRSAWTPDGKFITYGHAPEAWRTRADGTSAREFLFRETRNISCEVWSPDGKWLLYATTPAAPDSGEIRAFRPGIDKSPTPLIATKYKEGMPAFSPDGRWLAYTSNESGEYEIYVVPFPNIHDGKWAISSRGGTDPEWSHRGDEIFYRDSAANLVAMKIRTAPTFSAGTATRLFSTEPFQFFDFGVKNYAVSADDRRFLMIRRFKERDEHLIIVENWFEELTGSRKNRSGK